MPEKKTKKKTEEEILFPEAKVGDIVIRPWSFGKLFQQASILEKVFVKLEEKKLDIDNIFINSTISYVSIAKIFSTVSDEILNVISITLDKDIEEVKELDLQTGVQIAFTIFKQNKEIIKNAFTSLTM